MTPESDNSRVRYSEEANTGAWGEQTSRQVHTSMSSCWITQANSPHPPHPLQLVQLGTVSSWCSGAAVGDLLQGAQVGHGGAAEEAHE